MPVHYDPTRIRVRFCPRGHDKYISGVMTSGARSSRCFTCHCDSGSNGWKNPKRALRRYLHQLSLRMKVKRQKIAKLEKELGIYAAQE